ncbi:hypothetical protein GSB9_00159 [Flavobacteriaceae bacterium GSB9]|nr:hypothetical protein GSB9_00159 [Flavobacteriaceae bacterium GSB9]
MRKLIVPILAIFLMGCEETEEATQSVDSAAALEALTEYVTVNKIFQDVGNNSGDALLTAENTTGSRSAKSKSEGPTITVSPMDLTTFPKTTTIDYGAGVLCKDGVTRKGIVTAVSTGWYRETNSVHTTTFDNYYHEDFKVEGNHVVTNLGANADDQLQYSVVIDNGKIIMPTGASINYTENSTRTWVAGADTPFNIWDDEYKLDGSQTGKSSKGVPYTLTIEEDLHVLLLPRGIEAGILDVSVGSINNIKINYSASNITIFGETYPFGN